ncbi:MAG: ATP-binding protein [Bacteroidota bacterium]
MLQVTENEIKNRLRFDNPWWARPDDLDLLLEGLRERAYLDPFHTLVTNREVNRAVVLMGPRRVGKTVILRQSIQRLLASGVEPTRIFFVSLDNPVYTGLPLAKLLGFFQEMHSHDRFADVYVFFDEVQYLKEWEVHLKVLVDDYPTARFVVSGSAAAALKMKSNESGAGRFTDFLLPPLTFAEFLDFREIPADVDIERLNEELFAYINFGGFPEAVLKDSIRRDFQRFVGSDIIDKVLLRDIPSLYGIGDPQELNRFFATLAYNTGNEISIDELSKKSGVAKNTIRKYLEFLEAAFLIHCLHRVDKTAKRFQRETHFKVYLTNPCLRSALFGEVGQDDEKAGMLVETAVVAQYVQTDLIHQLSYARWKGGEIDILVQSTETTVPIEIKWQKSIYSSDARNIISFLEDNNRRDGLILTRDTWGHKTANNVSIGFIESSRACRSMSQNTLKKLAQGIRPRRRLPELDLPEREGPAPSQ